MGGEEKGAYQGHGIAEAHGKAAVKGHEPDPCQAEKGGGKVIKIRPPLVGDPIEKGYQNAVSRRQKGVFSGGGVGKADGLDAVGGEDEKPQNDPLPKAGAVQLC